MGISFFLHLNTNKTVPAELITDALSSEGVPFERYSPYLSGTILVLERNVHSD